MNLHHIFPSLAGDDAVHSALCNAGHGSQFTKRGISARQFSQRSYLFVCDLVEMWCCGIAAVITTSRVARITFTMSTMWTIIAPARYARIVVLRPIRLLQRGMNAAVLALREQLQILNAVVESVAVDVVDTFMIGNRPTNVLLHDEPMFINPRAVRCPDLEVSTINTAIRPAKGNALAPARTELRAAAYDVSRSCEEGHATHFTNTRDGRLARHWSQSLQCRAGAVLSSARLPRVRDFPRPQANFTTPSPTGGV